MDVGQSRVQVYRPPQARPGHWGETCLGGRRDVKDLSLPVPTVEITFDSP